MSIPAPKNWSPDKTCVALNRLVVADLDEGLVLGAAAVVVQGSEARRRLLHQVLRRRVFEGDLSKAITALGGRPIRKGSYRAKVTAVAQRIRQILVGGHEGDAYAACARATEKTSAAYTRALRLELPADVRFGLEQELFEIQCDRLELGRLRFGARPASSPVGGKRPENGEAFDAPLYSARNDEDALEAWSNEGGAG
ncbi:MAG TPA: hypothetical protein VFK05_07020 [Polyangiaceae bacterium]|nr:hypothetical protein [Polyangiaceae bacterium]